MKELALIAILLLQASGLWSHISNHAKDRLLAKGTQLNGQVAPPNPPTVYPTDPIPTQTGQASLNLSAASAYAIDTQTSTVLYSQNPTARRPIASITKLATTLVILSRHKTTDMVTVPTLPVYESGDEIIGLTAGEKYTVSDLVKAALIQSADDAADALALWDSKTIAKFAVHMNEKMGDWGIPGTRFSSASGLQDQDNYSTAESLANIARLALSNPTIKSDVAMQSATITSQSGRVINLTTTDDLLSSGAFYGIKTGYTIGAGECFVGLTRVGGHEVLTVVLGADDRFAATEQLVNWIGRNWQWL